MSGIWKSKGSNVGTFRDQDEIDRLFRTAVQQNRFRIQQFERDDPQGVFTMNSSSRSIRTSSRNSSWTTKRAWFVLSAGISRRAQKRTIAWSTSGSRESIAF